MTDYSACPASPILVTGAGGFIGRRVTALAKASGLTVLAPPRTVVDWTNLIAVRSYIECHRPATVIHLASSGVFATDPHDPLLIAHECSMLENILNAVPEGSRIINGGSMAEYGQSGRLDERMSCSPANAYARAKYESGLRLLGRLEHGSVSGCHVRIFGAFGTGEAETRLLPMLVERVRRGEVIALSDCAQKRDFVHVDDVGKALLALASPQSLPAPIINLGTGYSVPIRFAVERVLIELGSSLSSVRFGAISRSPHDQDVLEAETTKLRSAIGWVPEQHFNKALPILPLL